MTDTRSAAVLVCEALIQNLERQMPSLAEMATYGNPANPRDMGPKITLPAVHMHILLSRLRLLEAEGKSLRLDLTVAEKTSIGIMPDDVGGARAEYAGVTAAMMVRACGGDHVAAVDSLLHAASSILVTQYAPERAACALEVGAGMYADSVRASFKPTGAVQ